ncbi:hypothetical protein IQ06DRAFT_51061 [Phaeosphaeriaceae sp. SRC1lsM3a]|nr:hypothetical protein IQ06DRAFT_51061 [Stagonospora sp. SRC1lsM3a]
MSFCGYCDPQKVAIRASARPSPYVMSITAFCGEKGLRDQPQRPCEHCVRLARTWPPCSLPSTALQQLLIWRSARARHSSMEGSGQQRKQLHMIHPAQVLLAQMKSSRCSAQRTASSIASATSLQTVLQCWPTTSPAHTVHMPCIWGIIRDFRHSGSQ